MLRVSYPIPVLRLLHLNYFKVVQGHALLVHQRMRDPFSDSWLSCTSTF